MITREQNSAAIYSSQPILLSLFTRGDAGFQNAFPVVFSLVWFERDDIQLAIQISGSGFDIRNTFFVTPAELMAFLCSLLAIRRDCTGSATLQDYEYSLRLAVVATEGLWPTCHLSLMSALSGTLLSANTPPPVMSTNENLCASKTTSSGPPTEDTRLSFSIVDACLLETGYLRLLEAVREICRLTGADD